MPIRNVVVLNRKEKPIGFIKPVEARILLKEKKAKVKFKYCVRGKLFVIQLKIKESEINKKCSTKVKNRRDIILFKPKELALGIDPGSGKAGFAVSDVNGNVYYLSQVEVRNDIPNKMNQRRNYRRTRRNRKTRYRKPRFLNRASSRRENRLPPTLVSKLWSHKREILLILKLFPIKYISLEKAKFDTHAISKGRRLRSWEYQKGNQYGYETIKEYVKDRDKYQCCQCKKKGYGKNSVRLEVHHLIRRRDGGTNAPSNLITLCSQCHWLTHNKGLKLKTKVKSSITRHATHVDIIVSQLRKWFKHDEMFKGTTFNYIYGIRTKLIRNKLHLPKRHVCDAVSISLSRKNTDGKRLFKVINKVNKQSLIIYKKCVAKGDYQLAKGKRSEKPIPVGKVLGFRKFDKVKYNGEVYWIKGKRSTGYFELMNISGESIKFKPTPKASNLIRLRARSSLLVA